MTPRPLSRLDSLRAAWSRLRASGVPLAAAVAALVILLAVTA